MKTLRYVPKALLRMKILILTLIISPAVHAMQPTQRRNATQPTQRTDTALVAETQELQDRICAENRARTTENTREADALQASRDAWNYRMVVGALVLYCAVTVWNAHSSASADKQ